MPSGNRWTTTALTTDCLQSFYVIAKQCHGRWLPLLLVLTLGGELWLPRSCNYVFPSPWSWWQMTAVEKPVKETSCWKMRNDGSDRETIPGQEPQMYLRACLPGRCTAVCGESVHAAKMLSIKGTICNLPNLKWLKTNGPMLYICWVAHLHYPRCFRQWIYWIFSVTI